MNSDILTRYRPRAVGWLTRAARWNDRDISGLRAFLDKTPRCRAAFLAYGGNEVVKLADRLWAAPLATVLE